MRKTRTGTTPKAKKENAKHGPPFLAKKDGFVCFLDGRTLRCSAGASSLVVDDDGTAGAPMPLPGRTWDGEGPRGIVLLVLFRYVYKSDRGGDRGSNAYCNTAVLYVPQDRITGLLALLHAPLLDLLTKQYTSARMHGG